MYKIKKKNRKRKRSENAYSKKKVCRASNHQKNAGQPRQKAKKKMNRTEKKKEKSEQIKLVAARCWFY